MARRGTNPRSSWTPICIAWLAIRLGLIVKIAPRRLQVYWCNSCCIVGESDFGATEVRILVSCRLSLAPHREGPTAEASSLVPNPVLRVGAESTDLRLRGDVG